MGRKKVKIEMVTVCDSCGKLPPIDEEKSNENWIVYTISSPCECGGHWTTKIVETKD